MLRVLVVDGNELLRLYLRNVLARHFSFLSITEAVSGAGALALDAELHPQLVFLDVKLPDRSGLDLTRQIKRANPGVQVCLVTHYDAPEYRIAARECGADHLVVMGESTENAIVELVETTLARQRRTTARIGKSDGDLAWQGCLPDISG